MRSPMKTLMLLVTTMRKSKQLWRLSIVMVILMLTTTAVALGQELWTVNGLTLGMRAHEVVNVLGKQYKMHDLISYSGLEGVDYSLVYQLKEGLVEVVFADGRVWTVDGYVLRTPSYQIKKGDSRQKILTSLGQPFEETREALVYLRGRQLLMLNFSAHGLVESIVLEPAPEGLGDDK